MVLSQCKGIPLRNGVGENNLQCNQLHSRVRRDWLFTPPALSGRLLGTPVPVEVEMVAIDGKSLRVSRGP